jgi:glycosyltransferase involved in cell wall biosynthesis
MNVLIIGTTDILGGAAKVSWDIKATLEAQGDTVSMFVADKRSTNPEVTLIPRSKWRKILGFLFASEDFIASDWILNTDEFKKADIIHCHNIHGRYFNLGTLEKMALQKPVVWTLHDEWAITPHCAYTLEGTELKNGLYVCPSIDTPPRILWDNTRVLLQKRNALYKKIKLHVVTPSAWLLNRVKRTTLGTHDLRLIPNGVNTHAFKQTDKIAARTKLGLPLEKKIALFLATAGKANTWKGWKYTEEVITAYSDKPDVLFLNVGNLVPEANQPNVEYRLHVNSAEELALYYSAADVLLFTSIAENFPLVILEAMSCGLPIVAFDVGGVKEVVTHLENGYIGAYRNSNDLLEGLAWVFTLPDTVRTELSERSSAKIQAHYDTTQMTTAYVDLYHSLLSHE